MVASNCPVSQNQKTKIPRKRIQFLTYFSLVTACSSSMAMAQCSAWTSPVLDTLPPDAVSATAVDALLPGGAVIGVLAGWPALEAAGRRTALGIAGLLFLLGWALVAAAPGHLELLYPARVISGLAVGIVNIASTIYIAEISPPERRGCMYALAQVFTNMGLLAEYAAGAYLGWGGLTIVSATPVALFTVALIFVPESPYYLIRVNKLAEAEAVLSRLRSDVADVASELKAIQASVEGRAEWWQSGKRFGRSRANLRALAVCVGANVARQLTGGHAILSYAHSIFHAAGVATSAHTASLILAGVKTLSSSLTTSLTAKFGIKKLLVFSCGGVTFFLASLSAYFFVHESSYILAPGWNWFPLIAMILYFIFQDFGINPFPGFIGAEMFRGEVKGLGTAVCQSAGFVANTLTMCLVTGIDLRITLAIFAVCTLVSTPLLHAYVKDTHGMSLEEAQAHIYHKDVSNHI